jgi:hypothetical protein
MSNAQTLPLLFVNLISFTIGFLASSVILQQEQSHGNAPSGMRDELVLGLLLLAAFASGMFAAIILLTMLQ